MVFNQEFRLNNGSKSLHSFWATHLRYVLGKGKFSVCARAVMGKRRVRFLEIIENV